MFFFVEGKYEIINIPIDKSMDDPLKWVDQKSYIERLKEARKKTNSNCAVEFAVGKLINGIEVTCGAISFAHLGGSIGLHEGNTILAGIDKAIEKNINDSKLPQMVGKVVKEFSDILTI